METTIVYRSFIGTMENTMETTIISSRTAWQGTLHVNPKPLTLNGVNWTAPSFGLPLATEAGTPQVLEKHHVENHHQPALYEFSGCW